MFNGWQLFAKKQLAWTFVSHPFSLSFTKYEERERKGERDTDELVDETIGTNFQVKAYWGVSQSVINVRESDVKGMQQICIGKYTSKHI